VIEDDVAVPTGHGDQFEVRLGTVVDGFLLHDQTHFIGIVSTVEILVVNAMTIFWTR
jgi:hypothetical protein